MSSISSAALAPSVSVSSEPECVLSRSAKSMSGVVGTSPGAGLASRSSATYASSKRPTSVQLMLFVEDFPAKTSARPESESVSTAPEVACGPKCCDWCEKCDPVGSSLRTSLLCAIEAMTGCAPTWQRLVTPAGHSWWQLSTSELRKNASEHGLWQTPTTRDYKGQSGMGNRMRRGRNGKPHVANLCDQIVDTGRPDLVRSPTFREWLMGLPIGFTDSKPSETPSSPKFPKSSGAQS